MRTLHFDSLIDALRAVDYLTTETTLVFHLSEDRHNPAGRWLVTITGY